MYIDNLESKPNLYKQNSLFSHLCSLGFAEIESMKVEPELAFLTKKDKLRKF